MLASLFVTLASLTPLQEKIDAYVRPFADRRDFSGTILVRRKGNVLYTSAFGMANFELGASQCDKSAFRIASLTKTFTAAAIYILEKEGRLKFTDTLDKFLPNFTNAQSITLLHLLSHTSGVGSPAFDTNNPRPIPLDDLVTKIAQTPVQFQPGQGNSYSNSGYTLLAKVVEVASGDSFDEYLKRKILLPLKMTCTGSFGQSDFVPNRAAPYVPGPAPSFVSPVPGYDEYVYIGSGSLWSTSPDLAKWLDAVESKKLFDIDRLSWPMGWGKRTYFGRRANEQTGTSTGFTSGMIYFPDDGLQIIVLSNIQTQFPNRAIKDIAGIVYGEEPAQIVPPKILDDSVVDQKVVLGKYTIDGSATMEILRRNGHLYYHWNSDPDMRYLAPAGKTMLYARDEFALWSWLGPDTFEWSGPYGKMTLKRVK